MLFFKFSMPNLAQYFENGPLPLHSQPFAPIHQPINYILTLIYLLTPLKMSIQDKARQQKCNEELESSSTICGRKIFRVYIY